MRFTSEPLHCKLLDRGSLKHANGPFNIRKRSKINLYITNFSNRYFGKLMLKHHPVNFNVRDSPLFK